MQTTSVDQIECSFCRNKRVQVGPLVCGPGVYICEACVALSAQLLTGKPTAPFAGWTSLSDDEALATLPATSTAVTRAEERLRQHVQMLRRRGISWERIATGLGVSRQAAWERFSEES